METVTAELLSQFIPINALRSESQRDLLKKSVLQIFDVQSVLFRKGDATKQAMFVVRGTVLLEDEHGTLLATVTAGQANAKHPLAHQFPRHVQARCANEVSILMVDAPTMDVMLTWDQTGSLEVEEIQEQPQEEGDWMTKLLQMPTFQIVPPTNLQAIFMRMQPLTVEPGQVVIKQGDAGDYFYVLIEGKAMVTRNAPSAAPSPAPQQKTMRLAELESGACFGEEALIADVSRNANVVMMTHGKLMRLGKNDFRALLTEPLARKVSLEQAQAWAKNGEGAVLDVRMPSEFQNHHIAGSLNLPLYLLRAKAGSLKPEQKIVVCCDTGRRSLVGCFILTQKGFDTYLLQAGLPPRMPPA
jgi:CRP-like cAMP-binding protein